MNRMYRVIKRDGQSVDFDLAKVSSAISRAFDAVNRHYHRSVIDLLSLRVCADFEKKIKDDAIAVEDIQDSVEKTLINADFADVAKAYILYRKQREKARNVSNSMMDYREMVNSYVSGRTADFSGSLSDFVAGNSSLITANYWLMDVYNQEIVQAQRDGLLSIHDLGYLAADRSGWSIEELLRKGIDFRVISLPAKHLRVLCDQLVRFFLMMENEWAGAQTFCHFDTYLAPFVKKEELSYKEVKNCLESFVFGINTICFKDHYFSIVLDFTANPKLYDKPCIVGGEEQNFTYGDCLKEQQLICKAFLEVLLEGDGSKKPFGSPLAVIDLQEGFIANENLDLVIALVKKGIPIYFINKGLADGCFFLSDEKRGSLGTVSIDLLAIGARSGDAASFYKLLKDVITLAKESLLLKKDVLCKLFANGFYPYTQAFLGDFSQHLLSICLKGLYDFEAQSNYQLAADEVLSFVKEQLDERFLITMAASPALRKNTTEDANTKYTGQDYAVNGDLFADLDRSAIYSAYLDAFMDIAVAKSDAASLKALLKLIFDNYALKYFCFR